MFENDLTENINMENLMEMQNQNFEYSENKLEWNDQFSKVPENFKYMLELPEPLFTESLANHLDESKISLLTKIIKLCGKLKSVELLTETFNKLQDGGVNTSAGKKKTPGGIFMSIFKNDNSIPKEYRKKVFKEDRTTTLKNKRIKKKRMSDLINNISSFELDDNTT